MARRWRMKRRLRIAWLPDGKRLKLQDGPIDLIVQAFGRPGDIARAYDSAILRMRSLRDEMRGEAEKLRSPTTQEFQGRVARQMRQAVLPFHVEHVLSPVAAAAGAIADDVLAAMLEGAQLDRAFVNNAGDIAYHLASGQNFIMGMLEQPGNAHYPTKIFLDAGDPSRGIAMSGGRRRNYGLGIADSVMVTARSAAQADAAATMIANAVDLPNHEAVTRIAAKLLNPGSHLGETLVTTEVKALSTQDKRLALAQGLRLAEKFLAQGLITGAVLKLQDENAIAATDGIIPQQFLP
jgi:ApbE superfamily uncharacterized protein (UPF0280 family)